MPLEVNTCTDTTVPAAVVWMVASGNLNPPIVDSIVPTTVSFVSGVVVPMPTLPNPSMRITSVSPPDWSVENANELVPILKF